MPETPRSAAAFRTCKQIINPAQKQYPLRPDTMRKRAPGNASILTWAFTLAYAPPFGRRSLHALAAGAVVCVLIPGIVNADVLRKTCGNSA
ncbi:hypothetical protein DF3PA_230040 [Candidatus Defluviicoccus seviourii]|uniref:Uncharacterized protein n=1 Tax=Candidatus Defluviicoccus seviourii TaxID=2565273 RepID=A0A564WEW6_9PROT|nr:hypothetical protein DF3PA_230040 [Candidatus Defluviicoccus seviourii]